jgi:hypothetical protein
MAAKKKTTNATTAVAEPLKFTKGGFYQDHKGNLWHCTNGKTKTVGDQQVVMMQRTENGQPVGDATDELIDSFVKKLSTAELKEYREVCQRERGAEEAAKTASPSTKKSKSANAAVSGTEQPKAKTTTKSKPTNDQPKIEKMSALDAAAKVLGEATEPMATKEMIDAMSAKGYWTSPGGQTPHATLYAAILREINVKGREARFAKTDRGRFALAAQTGFKAVEEPNLAEQGVSNDDKPAAAGLGHDGAAEVVL